MGKRTIKTSAPFPPLKGRQFRMLAALSFQPGKPSRGFCEYVENARSRAHDPTDFGSSLSVQILICVTIGLEVDRSSDTRSNKGLAT